MQIVAATQNKDKIREIRHILSGLGLEILTMGDVGLGDVDIEESGATFEENAKMKAEAVSRLSGLPALADDSGLCVDALDGAPGIYSARYAGPDADGPANNAKLLQELRAVPDEERTGRYVSAVVIAYPGGRHVLALGECPGTLTRDQRGTGGFGYDTLFVPDGHDRTFAEMSEEEKNSISQRARALGKLRKHFEHE